MHSPRRVGIQRQIELIFPAEFKARFGHGVITDLRSGVAFGQIGGMRRDFVGDQSLFHILFVGQTQMLFRCDITQHRTTKPANHGGTDTRGEMVIAGRDIGGQRTEGVEGGFIAQLELFRHVAADHMHRHVARTFNHYLNIIFPGNTGQFTQGTQFGKLRFIVGILNRTRTQAIAQRQGDIVRHTDFTDLTEVLIEETLLMMGQAPLRHDRSAPRDDAGQTFRRHRDITQ